jgi:hypothetical protein
VGLYDLLERISDLAYWLALLSRSFNMFHVSQLWKCMFDPREVLEMLLLRVQEDLTYELVLMKRIDRETQVLRCRSLLL